MAKLKVTETAKHIALEGMQMMGGYGYATEYDMEGHVRTHARLDDLRRHERDPARIIGQDVWPLTAVAPAMNPARAAYGALVRSGILRPELPRQVRCAWPARARRWGSALAGAVAINAARLGDRVCLLDEAGTLTHRELHERTNRSPTRSPSAARPGRRGRRCCAATTAASSRRPSPSPSAAPTCCCSTPRSSGPQLADVVAREEPELLDARRGVRRARPRDARVRARGAEGTVARRDRRRGAPRRARAARGARAARSC